MANTEHLTALHIRLSHEKEYLAKAKKQNEIALRKVWIAQIEKEIADEMTFLGMAVTLPEISDDDLMTELLG